MEGMNRDVDQFRVRLDAGFTDGETLSTLDAGDIAYLGRLKSNKTLKKFAAPYLKRPPGRPPETPREWCHDLDYQAGSWESPRRVVLVVQENTDASPPNTFFLVTNLSRYHHPPEKVLAIYRTRGKAEAHMGELKSALDLHLSSTDRGASTVEDVMARNQVHLLLNLMAYQVLHGIRCLMERHTGQGWSLVKLREQALKVAAVITVNARQIRASLLINGGLACCLRLDDFKRCLPDLSDAELQQCWNDDRLIAADRLWAMGHVQYQNVIATCFFSALWHTSHAQNSSRIMKHANFMWMDMTSLHSQGVVNKAG